MGREAKFEGWGGGQEIKEDQGGRWGYYKIVKGKTSTLVKSSHRRGSHKNKDAQKESAPQRWFHEGKFA